MRPDFISPSKNQLSRDFHYISTNLTSSSWRRRHTQLFTQDKKKDYICWNCKNMHKFTCVRLRMQNVSHASKIFIVLTFSEHMHTDGSHLLANTWSRIYIHTYVCSIFPSVTQLKSILHNRKRTVAKPV